MEPIFHENKIITSLQVSAESGSFALDEKPLKFEKCRERFAPLFLPDTHGFYFTHIPGFGERIAKFILKTELILGETEHTTYAMTNRSTILWVKPSKFWKSCYIRRSLLTILLRAGNDYDPDRDNYESALFRQEYVIPTKKAVMRFLYGFTRYTGEIPIGAPTLIVKGWKMIFEGKTENEIRSLLVRPNSQKRLQCIELPDALWI